MLLLDVPLSSSTEELEGQTAEKAEKRQTQYERYVARFCLNSALVSRGETRRPRFQIRNLLRTERSLSLSLLFKGFFFSCTACLSQAIAFSRGWRLHPHITEADSFFILAFPSQVEMREDSSSLVAKCTRVWSSQADAWMEIANYPSRSFWTDESWLLNGVLCRTTWHVSPRGFAIGASGQKTSLQCEYFSLLMMSRSGLEQSVVRTGLWPVSWA